MKYYIPIHIDNIDNVISAESVAPADTYPVRGFGYPYFISLGNYTFNKVVILFNHVPKVENASANKQSACYIEVDDSCICEGGTRIALKNAVAIADTISLYPWNSRFLFLNEVDLYQAVMMCRSSLCNKMWEYYRFDLLDVSPVSVDNNLTNIEEEIPTKDVRLEAQYNRLKGFLFAYILGRYSSLSQSLAYFKQVERQMYDIATTIPGLQSYEKDAFLKRLNELEELFEKHDPAKGELQKLWKSLIERNFVGKENQEAFERVVHDLEAESLMKANLAKSAGITLWSRPSMAYARSYDWDSYKKSLGEYTQTQIQSFRTKKGNTDTSDDFTIDGITVTMNSEYGLFYGRLINRIILGLEWFNMDGLRLNRLDFASELTRMMRDIMVETGNVWEGSPVRVFMNDLRQHIASGAPFDLSKAPDITLKSIAIFVLKGDDFEEMMRLMEYNAVMDYRFVLGIWGACMGYVDTPKTVIHRMRLDSQGLSKIYLSTLQHIAKVPEGYNLTQHTYQFKRISKQQKTVDGLGKVLNDKSIGLTKVQKAALIEIWNRVNGKDDSAFYDQLSGIKGIGKVKLGRIKEVLSANEPVGKVVQPELFEKQQVDTPKKFDFNAWRYIEPMLPNDPIVRNKVKDDFRWYVNRIHKNETNESAISNYYKHLYQKAHPSNPRYYWTIDFFGKLDIDGIINQLKKIYL